MMFRTPFTLNFPFLSQNRERRQVKVVSNCGNNMAICITTTRNPSSSTDSSILRFVLMSVFLPSQHMYIMLSSNERFAFLKSWNYLLHLELDVYFPDVTESNMSFSRKLSSKSFLKYIQLCCFHVLLNRSFSEINDPMSGNNLSWIIHTESFILCLIDFLLFVANLVIQLCKIVANISKVFFSLKSKLH